MNDLMQENNARVQAMLAQVLTEAGWSEPEFLQALIEDLAENGRDRWKSVLTTAPLPKNLKRPRNSEKKRPKKS